MLKDREICSFASGVMSQSTYLEICILQYGVLPPLFFSFFLSEVKNIDLRGTPVLYADDL